MLVKLLNMFGFVKSSELDEMSFKAVNYSRQLSEAKTKIETLVKEMAIENNSKRLMQQELDRLMIENADLYNEMKHAKSEWKSNKNKVSRLLKKQHQYKLRISQLEADNHNLDIQLESLKAKNEKLEQTDRLKTGYQALLEAYIDRIKFGFALPLLSAGKSRNIEIVSLKKELK